MSATAQKQLDTLLRQHNFRLVRQTKHRVWRNPDGKVFVTSATPSDWRAVQKQLSDLKRIVASAPVPEVVAIGEFERQEALAKLARQEKKTGAAAGPAKSKGCGFIYIDEKKAVTSTLTPEQKQADREQRAWESLVRKTRQEFVASVAAKHRVLAPKVKQELQRRYREYAGTGLAYELQRHHDGVKHHKHSWMYTSIGELLRTRESQVDKLLPADFLDRITDCELCEKKDERIYYCHGHHYESRRAVALNVAQFMSFETTAEYAKRLEKMFNEIMRGETFQGKDSILNRYAVRKADELVKQLLASRPMKIAA